MPENFYALVAARHDQKESETATERTEKVEIGELPDTKAIYYDDWKATKFDAKVLKIVDKNIVLDQTAFYPVSGGQDHDTGKINGIPVVDVFKQGHNIIHVLAEKPCFKEKDTVKGESDFERRKQLTQHHTATHNRRFDQSPVHDDLIHGCSVLQLVLRFCCFSR